MTKENLLKKIQSNFFNNNVEYTVEELGQELQVFAQVFGELNANILENETLIHSEVATTIKYIDNDYVTEGFNTETKRIEKLKNPINMSVTIMEVNLDNNGNILSVENGDSFLTKDNKELTFFSNSLIGKKVIVN